VSRPLTIDFYKSESFERQGLDISGSILQAYGMPVDDRRVDVDDSFLILDNVRRRGRTILLGEIVKGRMNDIPDKVNRRTAVGTDLGLTADEGIGRHAHFLYDPSLQVLLLQRDREVRHPAFVEAIVEPTGAEFLLSLVFKRDAQARLEQLRTIRKISFKIARPVNPQAFRDLGLSAAAAIDLLNEQDGRFIEITISVGKQKRASLVRNAAMQLAQLLTGHGGADVRKVLVSGREDADGPIELIDLLEDRLTHRGEAEYLRRRVNPQDCERILLQAHAEHVAYLRNYRRQ
jgi:hypothetical protein